MMKLFVLFFLISSSCFAQREYKIALSSGCPYYCTEGGKQGYIVDLLQEFFKQKKIEVKFVTTPYARLEDSVLRGDNDIALFTSFDLRNSKEFEIYDVTLGVSSAGIISKTGTDPVILDIIDLKGKSIFLMPGSKVNELLLNRINKINQGKSMVQFITGSRIHDRLIELIALGRADYAIDDYNVLKYFYSTSDFRDKTLLTPSSISGYSPIKFASKKSLPIKNLIESDLKRFINNYRKSGKLQKLLNNYNIIDWNIVLTR
ncbi:hypothetical protein BIY24_05310 [Halobacteriovorax marinus]|uniref:substrate-binding periplasmic protein n=1 Tax=Halobacteriovorax marinus TaxID=97084 RepID=UPI000BC2CA9D|nr:transporter substrate-binding domain-containing protein [Halobacteriovorax marinus]ATH07375.1 hypothetical protein BIY24_05310 [Halobacteriovorax marinus]